MERYPLETSYLYHRRKGLSPKAAHGEAMLDLADGKTRYLSPSIIYNRAFAAYGESHLRWVEDAGKAGLRFVGFADEIAGLRHRGWYCDTFQDETYRGVVYQLPARRGESVFVYGYSEPWNDGVLLSFDWTADKEEAARWADRIAERAAEEQREYSEASSARLQHDEMADEASGIRKQALGWIREMKAGAATLANLPSIRCRLLQDVKAARDEILGLYRQRADLADAWSHHAGWKDY